MSDTKTFVSNEAEFGKDVAKYILAEAKKHILEKNIFRLVLSGGRTPIEIFKNLVDIQCEVDWGKIELFWVDERCVQIESEDSNYGNCERVLIDNLKVKPVVFPMYFSGDARCSAIKYQETLQSHFKDPAVPVFDLMLLGVGEDGHVASIFPDSLLSAEEDNGVFVKNVESQALSRITLTFPVIHLAETRLFIAKGVEKKWVYEECVDSKNNKSDIPACLAQSVKGNNIWFVSQDVVGI